MAVQARNEKDLDETIDVLAVSGSLRRSSYNRGLLEAATELAPEGMRIRLFKLSSLPLYNQDLEVEGPPAPAQAWTDAVAKSDGLLIATPEYNYSTSAAIKNAIEWASRPHRGSPLDGKPVALMGATPGRSGTARAQAQLRQMLAEPGASLVAEPEVLVSGARHKFDDNRNLTDPETRDQIRGLLVALGEAIQSSRKSNPEARERLPNAS